uniref:Uncharacterized protein n=1 Tax=Mustela putorius furo TaxID=9669 RepID=M3Z3J0_MUSPF
MTRSPELHPHTTPTFEPRERERERERERARAQPGEQQADGEREAGSLLSREPDVGLNPRTLGS